MKFPRNDSILIDEVERLLSDKTNETVKVLSSRLLGGGCINHASKIETTIGSLFLKWNADETSDIFLREAESLEELGKAADGQLVVPKVFAMKEIGSTPGFLVLEFLEPGFGSGNTDEKLGRGLATIHKYGAEKFGFYHDNYCGATIQNNSWKSGWVEFYRDSRLRFLLDLIRKRRPLPAGEIAVYDRLLDKIPELLPAEHTPALIHGDLWSGNYMDTIKGPALIDPASCFAAHEMEMGIMTLFGGFSQRFYDAYNEVYPLLHDWRERNPLYQLYHLLNHYYLFGGGYRSQAFQIAKSYL
jgi:fructosamine-3-kinase